MGAKLLNFSVEMSDNVFIEIDTFASETNYHINTVIRHVFTEYLEALFEQILLPKDKQDKIMHIFDNVRISFSELSEEENNIYDMDYIKLSKDDVLKIANKHFPGCSKNEIVGVEDTVNYYDDDQEYYLYEDGAVYIVCEANTVCNILYAFVPERITLKEVAKQHNLEITGHGKCVDSLL